MLLKLPTPRPPHQPAARAPLPVSVAVRAYAVALLCLVPVAGSFGGEAAAAESPGAANMPQSFALHGQLTYVEQETSAFRDPYRGANSLSPNNGRETIDATLYVGRKLWSGGEAWLNAEVDQGFGLDNTVGAAGFPSGEAYKVGKTAPYLRLSRAFVRQTVSLGGASQTVDPAQNQLGAAVTADRIVFTIGKYSVTDIFDTNQYAHDPRADFLNWSALDASSFDYAADAWGYTVGATAEWYTGPWTLRLGAIDLSDVPNSPHLEPGAHEFQTILEVERRFEVAGRAGRLLLTGYDSRARMGLLDDAVRLSGSTRRTVDIAAVRRFRSRTGIHASLEQQLSEELGVFARVGGASGNVEVYEFTDSDRNAEAGVSLKGSHWNRTGDRVGAAAIVNDISTARRRFLDAGGLGLLIGDGRLLHAGPEKILEAYYDCNVYSTVHIALDYQRIVNPGYNRDRGPASVFAVRLHAQF